MLAKDFDKAYGYITPGMRSTLSKEVFTGRLIGAAGSWIKAEAGAVRCAAEDCDVTVRLEYYLFPNVPQTSIFEEKWILIEGDWWFVYKG
ncbi:MAG TPA: hypothetical protein VFV17_01740 [Usitatibacteraceae bacterium]|nr:hypothetical protein [Usitatibacteraceae bacterium]